MSLCDVRQINLRRLMVERFEGSQTRLAKAVGRSAGYISRCLSQGQHRKKIGETLARDIEKQIGLENRWLDANADEQQISAFWHSHVEVPLMIECQVSEQSGIFKVVNSMETASVPLSVLHQRQLSRSQVAAASVPGSVFSPFLERVMIVIDQGDTSHREDKMFAIDHEGVLQVKYLQRMPGGRLRLKASISARQESPDVELEADWPERVRVLGRLVWLMADVA